MKRSLAMAFVIALTLSGAAWSGDGTRYGDGVTLETPTAIVELLEHPDRHVGQKVRVDGVVTSVCKKRGCWMEITDADTGKGIRIKVEDGVIVFPATAVGHQASAEGVLEVIHVAPGKEHRHGEGQGEGDGTKDGDCDDASKKAAEPENCDHGTGETILLIRGTGAIIS